MVLREGTRGQDIALVVGRETETVCSAALFLDRLGWPLGQWGGEHTCGFLSRHNWAFLERCGGRLSSIA